MWLIDDDNFFQVYNLKNSYVSLIKLFFFENI